MLTADLLPDRLRRDLGLAERPLEGPVLGAQARLLRAALPLMPGAGARVPARPRGARGA